MDTTLDDTALSTVSLLQGRLERLEHVLYGPSPTSRTKREPTTVTLCDLERRFAALVRQVRAYADILNIYRSDPGLFYPKADPEDPCLPESIVRATVLASATQFTIASSNLSAVHSIPIPDPKLSANLAALASRMKGIEAVQLAQMAEIAALRVRSEAVLRRWYEQGIVDNSEFASKIERRVARLNQGIGILERKADKDD